MLKSAVLGAFSLVVMGTPLLAAEMKGKIKSADAGQSTIVLTVGNQEKTIRVAADAELYTLGKAKKGKTPPKEHIVGGLGGLKAGTEVTVTTEVKDGKETATAIKVEAAKKKKKTDQ